MDPYDFNPLHPLLDALENDIETSFEPGLAPHPNADAYMDDLGRMLGQVERSIAGTESPPPPLKPLALAPEPGPHLSELPGPTSPGPPLIEEPTQRCMPELQAPPAAIPFFAHGGLARPTYRPHFGGSTGIRHEGGSGTKRTCRETGRLVDFATCKSCKKWADHGAGFEQCYYDWLDEKDSEDEDDEG